ncbi:Protein kinase-like (PK-like) [Glarea lozoyensis ATCC 20868]|uniref:Protein kinase-like (PK-like) n=1 Tax=Glarea lozoyensis (strain ATCC 20868 / MF5171) TaxID=1116229 RepID=S3D4C9_GLAL2|nr:Protein kinase-like (PK-like) [Glarea lozoyensis ATCC 20868]EPE33277.1 Protein kinase-like (PK-like) [Glarea lozoyensis ATCC 20868]
MDVPQDDPAHGPPKREAPRTRVTNPVRMSENNEIHDLGDTIYLTTVRRPISSEDGENPLSSTKPEDVSVLAAGAPNDPIIPIASSSEIKLGKLIRSSLRKSAGRDGGKDFLPIGSLHRILTRSRIRQEVAKEFSGSQDELENLVGEIWDIYSTSSSPFVQSRKTTRLRIFAILSLIGKTNEIKAFVEAGLYDSHLPFVLFNSSDGCPQLALPNETDQNPTNLIELFATWPEWAIESFAEKQVQLLSPYFQLSTSKHSEVLHYDFGAKIILPYIEKDPTRRRGGFGEVFRVKIHPECHNCCEDTAAPEKNPSYAVKRFLRDDPQAFEAEVSSLKRLNKKDNPNIITLLGTFAYREQYYLIFPWADGNLRDFWIQYPTPSNTVPAKLDYDWVLWFSEQCLGIAQGLEAIHSAVVQLESSSEKGSSDQLHGRHGDLKPENILWFENPNEVEGTPSSSVLKISDFGLTDFHRNRSKSGINAQTVGNSPTYRAPEYDVMKAVSQNYDIWTLGCVLLEFVTWFLSGWPEVDEFSEIRTNEDNNQVKEDTFFVLVYLKERNGQIGARLKESVVNQCNKLYDRENCSDYMVEFLNFIKDHLLRMNPRNRLACNKIVMKLSRLHERCVKDAKFSCLRREAIPVRHGTNLSTLEAAPIDVSPEQMRRQNKMRSSPPVHDGPVEPSLPSKDKEFTRHSLMIDDPEEATQESPIYMIQRSDGLRKLPEEIRTNNDLEQILPVAVAYDQNLTATPTSTTFGSEAHSRPQSPNKTYGSRPQSPATRKVHFDAKKGRTSIAEDGEDDEDDVNKEENYPSENVGDPTPSIDQSVKVEQTLLRDRHGISSLLNKELSTTINNLPGTSNLAPYHVVELEAQESHINSELEDVRTKDLLPAEHQDTLAIIPGSIRSTLNESDDKRQSRNIESTNDQETSTVVQQHVQPSYSQTGGQPFHRGNSNGKPSDKRMEIQEREPLEVEEATADNTGSKLKFIKNLLCRKLCCFNRNG